MLHEETSNFSLAHAHVLNVYSIPASSGTIEANIHPFLFIFIFLN